jgi:hypothetical protein
MAQVPNYSRYTITETGIVTDLKVEREIKPYLETNGYYRISLTNDDGLQQKYSIHRLVAETFIPNPDNLPVVDHINCNKLDNRVENLRWVTSSDNSQNWERENVYWDNTKNRWTARRMIAGKLIHIGCFKTIEDALEAVKKFKEDGTKAKAPSSSTGHKNIYLANGGGSWYVNILINKERHIKRGFKSIEEAIAYRDSL